jgi:uncharacterized protein (DUF362 family)
MGAVYDEFVRELAEWRRRYADQPRKEMVQLFLLALEREELVSVGYRETAIVRRLQTMPLSEEARDLIRHALLWLWKDEEMHAIYMRGILLKMGSLRLRAQAFARQMAGAIGGWSASVQQHARWGDAPLSRALATGVTWLGSALGKVPRDVREHLCYGPFRNFCLFNVDAEDTAELCWQRLIELVAPMSDLPPTLVEDFRHIAADEKRHGRIFRILADALDDQDRFVTGETVATLTAKIAQVSGYFLPTLQRAATGLDHPLGQGGAVRVVQGQAGDDKLAVFRRLLDDAGLAAQIGERARKLGKPLPEMRIAIKPTFMLGYHRKDLAHITDPSVLHELAGFLRGLGCDSSNIAVVESTNIYDQFYRNRTVHDVAAYFGYASPHYRLVDLAQEQVPHSYGRGLAQYTIGRTWGEADFRISFSKMRSHAVEMVHLTIGNVEWLGARCDEYLFAERQAHRETAVMMLLDDFPPHFGLLDGFDSAADGLMGTMGCPRPPAPRRFYAGADALAVDLVAGRHLGLANPHQSRVLQAACDWFGNPSTRIEVIGPDTPVRGWRSPYHTELTTLLSFFAYPMYQFGSGRGTLFVPEMDEQAFPPIQPAGSWVRGARRCLQMLLGLHHGRS